jgi:taurine dioxygenase
MKIARLALFTGAEIGGVDLSRPLSAGEIARIRATLLKYKVVFFRGQNLDHDRHVAFARQFGEITVGHAVYGTAEDHPELYHVAKEDERDRHGPDAMVVPWRNWHTDITPAINPPMASILRGVIVPPYGGDTQWTNLAAAYHGLSAPMREFVDTLRGLHRYAPRPNANHVKSNRPGLISEHPLVRVHPETGEKVLFVSPVFLAEIVGMRPRESQKLLEFLWEHVTRPDFTVRFKWNAGDIAFWDNRATAHLPPTDIFQSDFDRQHYRVTLMGDIPVGPDGLPSRSIEGTPIEAIH